MPSFLPQPSISRALSIIVFLLIMVIQIPLVLYYFTWESHQIETRFQIKSEENAQRLAEILKFPILQMDKRQIERIALAFTRRDSDVSIGIRDTHGYIFFDSIPHNNHREPCQTITAEIKNNDKIIGYIDFHISRALHKQEQSRLRNQALWILGLSLLSIYISLRLLSRFFIRPFLRSLIESLEKITAEDYDHAFKQIRYKEIKSLARTFRDMAERIKARENVLLMINKELQSEVSERKKAEEDALQSEARRKALLDAIPDMIFHFSEEGTFLDFQGDKTFLYLEPKAFLHQKAHAIFPEAVASLIEKNISKALQTRTPQLFEYKLPMDDGRIEYFEVCMVAATDHTVLAISRNISNRVRAAEEKGLLEFQLVKAQKMEAIGTLAGGVAHDLNNVLTGLVSYPDLILQDLPKNSPMYHRITLIKKSGQKAAQIVQDLLTLARRGVAATEVIQLNAIVEDYLSSAEYENMISFHPEVMVETRLDPNLPLLKGSGLHLGKMIMNLVANAAEAMPEGGLLILETVFLPQVLPAFPGGAICLKVQDTGMGIHPDDKEKIFEPFYTQKIMGRSGTGLGMAVVWNTVQDHKGEIEVDSALQEGCTISILLPVKPGLSLLSEEKTPIPMGKGQHVLVVNNFPEQQEIANLILSKQGYRVSTLTNGEETLQKISALAPDLVLLDMVMGVDDLDGIECFQRIRTLMPELKVLFVTDFAKDERIEKAMDLGALGYIKKPYTLDLLSRAVHEALLPEKKQT